MGQLAAGSTCPACSAALTPDAAWCHRCGSVIRPARSHRGLWAAAIGASLLFTAYIARQASSFNAGPPPAMANAGNAGPAAPGGGSRGGAAGVDIASMTPRERFDRLFARVMGAAEQGDTAQAAQFAPMALMAYAQLDRVDQDARFHAGLIRGQVGDWAGVMATADTMLAETPDHLLALLLQEAAAERRGDRRTAEAARQRFNAAWDRELAAGRQEYTDHRDALDDFRARE
jgi:hypothetical protein